VSVALSVVVPSRDEAANLPALVERLGAALGAWVGRYEVIVVDDGSTDDTARLLRDLGHGHPELRWVRLSRNFGKESAILAGLDAAEGDLIAIIDGDLQHPPELLPDMIDVLASSGADQVVGVRTRAGEGSARKWMSRVYASALARFSDVEVPRGYGDFRVFTRRVRDAVVGLSETTRFNRGLFAWVGFPTVAFAFTDAARSGARSRWKPSQLVGYGLDGMLSFSARPLRFLIVLGAVSMGLFLLYVVAVIVRVLLFGIETPGYVTLIAAVFFVGGMQSFSAGMLGEYLGRIFLEVKNRPIYIEMESGRGRSGQEEPGR
jgi:glycosyltransferase involved in cell wall biosynthesis